MHEVAEKLDALSETERRRLQLATRYGAPDFYLSDKDTLWHPWVGQIFLKPLLFDLKHATYHTVLESKGPGIIGRHRHRGAVVAYTLEGTWRYQEYDWVARPGDFVLENPGVIHTLYSDTGCKAYFGVTGSLEFYDGREQLTDIMDVFGFLELYTTYCSENSIPLNENLIVR